VTEPAACVVRATLALASGDLDRFDEQVERANEGSERSAGAHDEIENVIGGNSFSELKGLIYIPSETLRIDANNSPDIQCGRFIGRRLIIQGRVMIAKGCSDSGVVNFRGTEVRLVG